MANKFIAQPPLQTNLLSTNVKEKINEFWARWVDDLHRSLSERSFQAVTSAQALDVNAKYISLTTTTGSYAVTLEAPTKPTARLQIEMIARGGAFDVTMSLANCEGGTASTTCTWNSVGDTLFLESRSNKWVVIKQQGVALT